MRRESELGSVSRDPGAWFISVGFIVGPALWWREAGGAMASVRGALPDNQVAQAREKFLAHGSAHPPEVREAILASWRRSREWSVAADRIESPYVREPDLDTPLMRSALPVLGQLRDHLA